MFYKYSTVKILYSELSLNMKRKDFLKKVAIGTAGLAAVTTSCRNEEVASSGAPAIHTGKKYKWNMLTTWPPNYPIIGEGCEKFAQWIKEMSGGRLTIKVYGCLLYTSPSPRDRG